ncbi:MAG TPA: LON peptidase substrate-binding domain-containing protein [Thermoanaerobaculia bacterium]|nr:LON peptidase substrate-binding domain-containing protein [Thermoanaerobaculia bacterium]
MKIQDLPMVVPVFPLEAPLLLPGTVVPFRALEPRYLSLVEDALAGDGYIGILQPMEEGMDAGDPALYTVGCLGKIGECYEDEPGELLVLAAGLIRFRVLQEVPGERGYRQAIVDYAEFLGDVAEVEEELEFSTLREMVRQRIETNRSEFDLSIMDGMAGTEIVTAIAHAISLSSAERQMLMETSHLSELEEVLLQLMMGVGGVPSFDVSSSMPS